MKQLQILDMDALTPSTKHFAIPAGNPCLRGGQVQIPNLALCPAVNTRCMLTATVADGLKPLVGMYMDMGNGGFWGDGLLNNFYSTKGKIWCYTESGHRRSPSDMVCLGRQTYIRGDTGCPFYLISMRFHFVCFN